MRTRRSSVSKAETLWAEGLAAGNAQAALDCAATLSLHSYNNTPYHAPYPGINPDHSDTRDLGRIRDAAGGTQRIARSRSVG